MPGPFLSRIHGFRDGWSRSACYEDAGVPQLSVAQFVELSSNVDSNNVSVYAIDATRVALKRANGPPSKTGGGALGISICTVAMRMLEPNGRATQEAHRRYAALRFTLPTVHERAIRGAEPAGARPPPRCTERMP
jgi:hypothetical protein